MKLGISSFLLLLSVLTPGRENSLACLSSSQQPSCESESPSALTASVPFLLFLTYVSPRTKIVGATCFTHL